MRSILPAALLGVAAALATPVHATAQTHGDRPFVLLQFQPAYPGDPNPATVIYDRLVRQAAAELGPRLLGGQPLAAELGEDMAGCAVTPLCRDSVRARYQPAALVTGVIGREPDGTVRGRLVIAGPDGREYQVVDLRFAPGAEAELGTALIGTLKAIAAPAPVASGSGGVPADPYGAPQGDLPPVDPYAPPSAVAAPGVPPAPTPGVDPYGAPAGGSPDPYAASRDPYGGAGTTPPAPVRPHAPPPPAAPVVAPVSAGASVRPAPRSLGDTRGFHVRGGVGYAMGALRQLYSSTIYIDSSFARTEEYSWSTVDFQPYAFSAFLGIDYGITPHVEIGVDAGAIVGQNSMRMEYATSEGPGSVGAGAWQDHAALFGIFDPRVRFYLVPARRAATSRANVYAGFGLPFVVTAPFKTVESSITDEDGNVKATAKYYDDRSAGLLFGPEFALGLRVAASPTTAFFLDVPVAFLLLDSKVIGVEDLTQSQLVPGDPSAEIDSFRLLLRVQAGLQFRL